MDGIDNMFFCCCVYDTDGCLGCQGGESDIDGREGEDAYFLLYLSYAPEMTMTKVIIARTAPSIQAPVGMSHSLE